MTAQYVDVELWIDEDAFLYDQLLVRADDEGLLYWGPKSYHVPTELAALTATGLVRPYVGGRSQQQHVWLPGVRREPGPPASDLPPPSLKNGAVFQTYVRRDNNTCHLCGFRTRLGDRPEASPSMDHLIPKSRGGTDYPSNIATSHQSCNKARKDRPLGLARAREHQRSPWWRR